MIEGQGHLIGLPKAQGLYLPEFERDACGVGLVCHIKGKASHSIIDNALEMLERMNHRGACGCELDSGDGAGIMLQIPDKYMRREMAKQGVTLPPKGQYAVSQIFLPKDMVSRNSCQHIVEKTVKDYGMVVLGWRDVPTDPKYVGPTPKRTEPKIRQLFVAMGETFYNRADFERRLYLVRQRIENIIEFGELSDAVREGFYMCALSVSRIIYKGMLTAHQVRMYYKDLQDSEFTSAMAIVHSRFSTNTFPSWRLAHPYRYLAHNGEINTVRGNVNWMAARRGSMESELLGADLDKMWPIIPHGQSDTACIDNALELLVAGGYSLAHAMMMLIPEAWSGNTLMDPQRRAFYEYHAALLEPWDGPAAIAFTDGRQIGATLDRNGLRPARYIVTDDDHVIMASEAGVLPVPEERIVHKWRLQPGKMLLIDLQQGRIIDDDEIKSTLAEAEPYEEWL